jgi:hypothetical protein
MNFCSKVNNIYIERQRVFKRIIKIVKYILIYKTFLKNFFLMQIIYKDLSQVFKIDDRFLRPINNRFICGKIKNRIHY